MTLSDLKFKRVELSELELLRDISLKTFHDAFYKLNAPESYDAYVNKAFSKSQLQAEILNRFSEFYFLYSGNKLAGYFKLNFRSAQTEFQDPDAVEIERIYISSEYQNAGLGKYILNHIKFISESKDLYYIWLGVWEKNQNAIRFYEKNGFRIFSSHPFYLGKEIQTDLLMKYVLKTL